MVSIWIYIIYTYTSTYNVELRNTTIVSYCFYFMMFMVYHLLRYRKSPAPAIEAPSWRTCQIWWAPESCINFCPMISHWKNHVSPQRQTSAKSHRGGASSDASGPSQSQSQWSHAAAKWKLKVLFEGLRQPGPWQHRKIFSPQVKIRWV